MTFFMIGYDNGEIGGNYMSRTLYENLRDAISVLEEVGYTVVEKGRDKGCLLAFRLPDEMDEAYIYMAQVKEAEVPQEQIHIGKEAYAQLLKELERLREICDSDARALEWETGHDESEYKEVFGRINNLLV